MAIVLGKPGVDGLNQAVGVLREWLYDAAPMQLHPGDLGWFWRFGAEATAAAVRIWSRDGQVLAVGLLDGPKLMRLTIAPDAQRDEELADQLVDDMAAAGLPYCDARCLVACDDEGNAVAAVTVWSAGPAKPGLLEPMGVHREHRGHGYGKAITLAAAAALQELGSSSAIVCTPSSNGGALATYESAGFQPLPEIRDRRRDL